MIWPGILEAFLSFLIQVLTLDVAYEELRRISHEKVKEDMECHMAGLDIFLCNGYPCLQN